MTESCAECRFFFKEAEDHGVCRRYPPQMIVAERAQKAVLATAGGQPQPTVITTQCSGMFPYVGIVGWCGEWAAMAKDVN